MVSFLKPFLFLVTLGFLQRKLFSGHSLWKSSWPAKVSLLPQYYLVLTLRTKFYLISPNRQSCSIVQGQTMGRYTSVFCSSSVTCTLLQLGFQVGFWGLFPFSVQLLTPKQLILISLQSLDNQVNQFRTISLICNFLSTYTLRQFIQEGLQSIVIGSIVIGSGPDSRSKNIEHNQEDSHQPYSIICCVLKKISVFWQDFTSDFNTNPAIYFLLPGHKYHTANF